MNDTLVKSIVVDENGTELSYIDSGIPPGVSSYVTLFAVHGIIFTKFIFQKVMALAPAYGMRIVAVNRRNYPGSTAFGTDEANILRGGSDVQKANFVRSLGIQLGTFIDAMIQKEELPAVSSDGKYGGIALMGWSLGNSLTLSMISNLDGLSADVLARLSSRLRAHIMLEPPREALGTPAPPQDWRPVLGGGAPDDVQLGFAIQWLTAYFKHGDLSKRRLDDLSFILPATTRPPSIYNMTADQVAQIVYEPPISGFDGLSMASLSTQTLDNFRNACFGGNAVRLMPSMKTWIIIGDATLAPMIAAFWAVQDEDKASGGGSIHYKVMKGVNHFMHWDEPVMTLEVLQQILSE